MDALETLGLMAELHNTHCGLNHGPIENKASFTAVDWLVIPLGDMKTKVVMDKLVIPVCQDCADGLASHDWVLLYCVECSGSQWVLKKLSKINYNKELILSVGCPKCSKKAEGVFTI